MNWSVIEKNIAKQTGKAFIIDSRSSLGGGCINEAWHISGLGQEYFVKINVVARLAMFEAEREGLDAMCQTDSIRIPHTIVSGTCGPNAYLVLEYISLQGHGQTEEMGRQLARMHQSTQSCFGWHRNNTIGSTEQVNEPEHDWLAFWREKRLGFQTRLAANKGLDKKNLLLCEQLADCLPALLDHQPQPSLLHGDLWSGNAAYDAQGNPVIFDPASYYGDREADLAMTELFGGFSSRFYSAYQELWPLDEAYRVRKILYNQYHILNHYNLFGGSYGDQAGRMAAQVIAECR